jgi:hypothetical protein
MVQTSKEMENVTIFLILEENFVISATKKRDIKKRK